MAKRHQHCGERSFSSGQIEVGGNVMIRTTLEDNLFDAITVAFEFADHLSIQRRLLGKAADRLDELGSQLLAAFVDVLGRLDGGDRLMVRIELLLALRNQIRVQHLARRHVPLRRQHREIVGGE